VPAGIVKVVSKVPRSVTSTPDLTTALSNVISTVDSASKLAPVTVITSPGRPTLGLKMICGSSISLKLALATTASPSSTTSTSYVPLAVPAGTMKVAARMPSTATTMPVSTTVPSNAIL